MRYLVEKRTVYGRTTYAVMEVDPERTVARCDTYADAALMVMALETYVARKAVK